MEFKRMKAAVVGCGMISDTYIPSIQNNFSILELVGCSDLNEAAMQAKAEKYGLKAMTQAEIIADPEIELVINLTNPAAHYPVTKTYLEAGKNVWSEKMIAVELEQGRELVEIAEKNHVALGVAPDTFLGASVQTARFLIDSGMIGEPLSYVAYLSRDYGCFGEVLPHLRKRGGGILFDMGGYYLTALGSIFGPVREACAFTAIHAPNRTGTRTDRDCQYFGQPYEIETSNIVAASLKYDSGVIGSLHMNSDCIYNATTGITVYGTEGVLKMGDPNGFGGDVTVKKIGSPEFVFPLTHGYKENSRGIGAAEMAWSIRQGRLHRANMYMAYNVFETAHAIERASAEGRTIRLESTFAIPAALPQGYIQKGALSPMAESALAK